MFVNNIDIYPSIFKLCFLTTLNIPFKTSIPCKSAKSVVFIIENISYKSFKYFSFISLQSFNGLFPINEMLYIILAHSFALPFTIYFKKSPKAFFLPSFKFITIPTSKTVNYTVALDFFINSCTLFSY